MVAADSSDLTQFYISLELDKKEGSIFAIGRFSVTASEYFYKI